MAFDITERTTALMQHFNVNTFKGVRVGPIQPEFRLCWGPDYAIVCGVFLHREMIDLPVVAEDYFDWERFDCDFECFLGEWFRGPDEDLVLVQTYRPSPSAVQVTRSTIVVRYYEKAQELEVSRVVPANLTDEMGA